MGKFFDVLFTDSLTQAGRAMTTSEKNIIRHSDDKINVQATFENAAFQLGEFTKEDVRDWIVNHGVGISKEGETSESHIHDGTLGAAYTKASNKGYIEYDKQADKYRWVGYGDSDGSAGNGSAEESSTRDRSRSGVSAEDVQSAGDLADGLTYLGRQMIDSIGMFDDQVDELMKMAERVVDIAETVPEDTADDDLLDALEESLETVETLKAEIDELDSENQTLRQRIDDQQQTIDRLMEEEGEEPEPEEEEEPEGRPESVRERMRRLGIGQ